MKLFARMFILCLAALGIGAGMAFAADSAGSGAWRTLGDKAPELNVDFVKGDPVLIGDSAGEHVFVVEFWATWCGPCRYTAPHLSELQAKYRDQGLLVLGISDETKDIVDPYLTEMGDKITYSIALDRARITASRYFEGFGRQENLPTAYVVDGNGRVAWIGTPLNPFMDTIIQSTLAELPRIREDRARAAAKRENTGESSEE
jgi:thiol-disulfide isomerase/thioredoxin